MAYPKKVMQRCDTSYRSIDPVISLLPPLYLYVVILLFGFAISFGEMPVVGSLQDQILSSCRD